MNDKVETIRVFIALEIPPAAKQSLTDTIHRLQAEIPGGVRWVDPAGIHLTLKFLGNVDPKLVDDIFKAMRCAALSYQGHRFRLRLSGLGLFPNEKQPRVLWAGAEGDLEALQRLQEQVDQAVSKLQFRRERRPLQPHLTLGRVRDGASPSVRRSVAATFSTVHLEPGESWEVDAMHLIQSILTPGGPVYTSLGSISL